MGIFFLLGPLLLGPLPGLALEVGDNAPGPVLRFAQGEGPLVEVTNSSRRPVAFFFHGPPGPTKYNGLQGVSRSWSTPSASRFFYTNLLGPQSSRDIEFPTQSPGAYLYRSASFRRGGVYGVAIVEEAPPEGHQGVVLAGPQASSQGPSQAPILAGETVEVLLFNSWPQRFLSFRFGHMRSFQIVSKDSFPIIPTWGDSLLVAPGESYTVVLTMPPHSITFGAPGQDAEGLTLVGEQGGPIERASDAPSQAPLDGLWAIALQDTPLQGPDTGLVIELHRPQTIPIQIIHQAAVTLTMVNSTENPQSVHLQGHTFEVVGPNGLGRLSHTLGILPGEEVTVRFRASQLGHWPLFLGHPEQLGQSILAIFQCVSPYAAKPLATNVFSFFSWQNLTTFNPVKDFAYWKGHWRPSERWHVKSMIGPKLAPLPGYYGLIQHTYQLPLPWETLFPIQIRNSYQSSITPRGLVNEAQLGLSIAF